MTTTLFDMVVLNDLDRYHLVMDVIDRVPGLLFRAAHVRQAMRDRRSSTRRTSPSMGTTGRKCGTGDGRTREPRYSRGTDAVAARAAALLDGKLASAFGARVRELKR
jgi:hypothetical protein